MAQSPAHRFGQIIGAIVEPAIEPLLRSFADEHGLYLDKQGPRAARKGRRKVSWVDLHGNKHDLDYVLERGGTDQMVGVPVAFVETAWRTYTKHSRNKVQEIQGAIMPLLETHHRVAPFIGVMLAGVFTEGARNSLKSHGFTVLYFSHADVSAAFGVVGIDTVWREATLDDEMAARVKMFEALSAGQREEVGAALLAQKPDDVRIFMDSLTSSITRQIEYVRVTPLHGTMCECVSLKHAIEFIEDYDETIPLGEFARYEVELRYGNNDRISGDFEDRATAVEFLRSFLPTLAQPVGSDED